VPLPAEPRGGRDALRKLRPTPIRRAFHNTGFIEQCVGFQTVASSCFRRQSTISSKRFTSTRTSSRQLHASAQPSRDRSRRLDRIRPPRRPANTNPPGVFGGPSLEWLTENAKRDAEVLDAVSRFGGQHRQLPTQDSWTAAGMSPCERTVRARFGSFRAAAEAAGLIVHP